MDQRAEHSKSCLLAAAPPTYHSCCNFESSCSSVAIDSTTAHSRIHCSKDLARSHTTAQGNNHSSHNLDTVFG